MEHISTLQPQVNRDAEGPIPVNPGDAAVRQSHMYSDDGIIPVVHGNKFPEPPIPGQGGYATDTLHSGYPQEFKNGTYYASGLAPHNYDHSTNGSQTGLGPTDPRAPPRRRRRWIYILAGVILLLAIVGSVVGGILGSKASKKDKNADDTIVTSSNSVNASSPSNTVEESLDLPTRVGILASQQTGPVGGSGVWFSDKDQVLWNGNFDGKNINKKLELYNTSQSTTLSEEQKKALPVPYSPLAFCSLTAGTALVYVNMAGAIDARWLALNSKGAWTAIEKTGATGSLAASGETQIATVLHWIPSANSTVCLVVYQENAGTALSLTYLSANITDPLKPKLIVGEKKTIPLVNPDDKDYEPLKSTSLLTAPSWMTFNVAPDYNGATVVYYQTKSGKIVGSVFDPNTTDSNPKLIRSEELGEALLKTPLTITTEVTVKATNGYVREGNYTIYGLSKPRTIKTWYSDNRSLRSRSTDKVLWKEGPEVKGYKGGEVAAMAADSSLASTFYVASEDLKGLVSVKQATTAGAIREWSGF